MVTRILFDPRVDLPDGTTGPTPVIVEATPTGIRADGSVFVLPTTLTFTINTSADQLLLAAPAVSWGWSLAIRRAGAMLYGGSQAGSVLARRTVTWADAATIAWADLTDLDPATLEPTSDVSASWAATQALAQEALDAADTKLDQSAVDARITELASPPVHHYLSARIGSSDGSSTAYTGIGTFTIVPLDVVDYDSAGAFDTSAGVYTIPVDGYWQINAAIRPVDGQAVRQIGMGVDTANRDSATFAWLETNPGRSTLLYSRVSHFVAGEQVRLFTYADAEGTTNFNTGALSLTLLGG